MPNVRTFTRAFASGEVSPELFGHFDLDRMAQAVATMRNFIALPHGPAANRPGTEFVKEVGGAGGTTAIISFSFNNVQSFAIEFGAGYFRWHTQGATLLYTPAPWSASVTYFPNDLVTSGGVTYACLVSNTNVVPVVGPSWRLAAWRLLLQPSERQLGAPAGHQPDVVVSAAG
jgi:hypothetical protein